MRIKHKKAKAPNRKSKIAEITEMLTRKKRMRNLGLIIVLSLIILIFISGNRGTLKLLNFYSQKKTLELEVKQLETKVEKLQQQKTSLKTDPKAIEKVAREKYKMKKKGERVYEIIEK